MSLEAKAIKAFSKKGEREATRFLKQNPHLVLWGFVRTGGHSKYVLNEFPLGSRYRADFFVPFSYSGVWEIHFIELENTDDPTITQDGKPSQRLNSAISQLHDWNDYIQRNRVSVQQDLSDWCNRKDLLGWHETKKPPSNMTTDRLNDPSIYIRWCYHIIIGRRENVSKEKRRKMNQLTDSFDRIQIGTFDRFIDIARNHDEANSNREKSVYLPVTED
jgi:hypothetical protein